MRDQHLPEFLFKCAACEGPIPDPDRGIGEPITKGGGFSSMKLFCSQECADGTAVEAALLLMDEENEEEKEELDDDDDDDEADDSATAEEAEDGEDEAT